MIYSKCDLERVSDLCSDLAKNTRFGTNNAFYEFIKATFANELLFNVTVLLLCVH